ncbi:MAG: hypothetical protein LIP01_04380 [Tannerellaceae bacterium]|nr:hypothetical protein [Tannerellaceae bacterium]
MAVTILIKPETKSGLLNSVLGKNNKLTLSGLKKIAGNEFVYGHRNRKGYVFSEYDEEDITGMDIVLYTPGK